MTGFGRTGVAFGSQLYNVHPDLLVAGKGLAGGYAAIAGVFGREEIANAISAAGFNVMFHTFGALPQSCAAATAVLKILREENLVQRAGVIGQHTLERLQTSFGQHPNVAEIRGAGMLIGIEIVKDRNTLERFDESARHRAHRWSGDGCWGVFLPRRHWRIPRCHLHRRALYNR